MVFLPFTVINAFVYHYHWALQVILRSNVVVTKFPTARFRLFHSAKITAFSHATNGRQHLNM